MKRLLLLLFAFVCVWPVSAQEVNSSQCQSETISVDSLSTRINKLQHDYNFMYCDFELHKLIMDLKDLAHSTDISSNRLLNNYYNSRYDHDLYNAYVKDYDTSCAFYNSLKDKIRVIKLAISYKIASSDFSEEELNVIYAGLDLIEHASKKVESALKYYDVAIRAYKSKR